MVPILFSQWGLALFRAGSGSVVLAPALSVFFCFGGGDPYSEPLDRVEQVGRAVGHGGRLVLRAAAQVAAALRGRGARGGLTTEVGVSTAIALGGR